MRNVCTLRQERAHQIYKDIARKCKRYQHFDKFAARKAVLRECLHAANTRFRSEVIVYNNKEYQGNYFTDSNNVVVTNKIKFQQVIYRNENVIVLKRHGGFCYDALLITKILVNHNFRSKESIYFQGHKIQLIYERCGMLKIEKQSDAEVIIPFKELFDFYPLYVNYVDETGTKYLLKKHEFLFV